MMRRGEDMVLPPRRSAEGGDAGGDLVEDPSVGLLQAVTQRGRWLPPVAALHDRVVAVAATNALRRVELVLALDGDPGDLLDDVDHLVDGDELAGTQVDGVEIRPRGDHADALQAVIDVHETTGLLA